MSNASAGESAPIKPQKTLTALQQLEAQLKEARAKVTDERNRIKKERLADKQKSHALLTLGSIVAYTSLPRWPNSLRGHALLTLGSIVAYGGKEQIAKVLASADWLEADKKLAVEYYYGLCERPKDGKKSSGGSSDGKSGG